MLDMNNKRHARLAERLREDIMIWLSSVRPDGRAHLVPVWFLWDEAGGVIYIFSKPDQKVRNLRENKAVMLGLDDTKGGSEPFMMAGEAELLTHDEIRDTVWAPYYEKYGSLMTRFGWTIESMTAEYDEVIRVRVEKYL